MFVSPGLLATQSCWVPRGNDAGLWLLNYISERISVAQLELVAVSQCEVLEEAGTVDRCWRKPRCCSIVAIIRRRARYGTVRHESVRVLVVQFKTLIRASKP